MEHLAGNAQELVGNMQEGVARIWHTVFTACTNGRGERMAKELKRGVFQIEDGMEILRLPVGHEVWWSTEIHKGEGAVTFRAHIDPKPEEIQPDWFKAEKR